MPHGGVTERPQAFKVTCTKLVSESQRSRSRDTVASFPVKNSPQARLPLPTPGQESSALADAAGTMSWLDRVIVQNILWIIREHEPAVPQAKLPSWDGVTSHTLGSLYRMT